MLGDRRRQIVLMLGRVSEKVLSGASLAGQIQFVMTLILFGTTSGATDFDCTVLGKERYTDD